MLSEDTKQALDIFSSVLLEEGGDSSFTARELLDMHANNAPACYEHIAAELRTREAEQYLAGKMGMM